MNVAVINSSTVVSDNEGQLIVDALNQLLPQFCQDWNLPLYTAVYIGLGKITDIFLKVNILDRSDILGIFGFHHVIDGIPYAKCFAKSVLIHDGDILSSSSKKLTVSQCVSHEVYELLVDPMCSGWWDVGDGKTLFAREVCDPVENNGITVSVVTNPKSPPTPVTLSDWILPAWTNSQNTTGPFNYLKTLKAPFTLDNGGSIIKMTLEHTGLVFGSEVTEEKRQQYLAKAGISRRMT